MIKKLPAGAKGIQETGIQSLGGEDPLEEGMATFSGILAWRIPMGTEARWATVHRISQLDMTEAT